MLQLIRPSSYKLKISWIPKYNLQKSIWFAWPTRSITSSLVLTDLKLTRCVAEWARDYKFSGLDGFAAKLLNNMVLNFGPFRPKFPIHTGPVRGRFRTKVKPTISFHRRRKPRMKLPQKQKLRLELLAQAEEYPELLRKHCGVPWYWTVSSGFGPFWSGTAGMYRPNHRPVLPVGSDFTLLNNKVGNLLYRCWWPRVVGTCLRFKSFISVVTAVVLIKLSHIGLMNR